MTLVGQDVASSSQELSSSRGENSAATKEPAAFIEEIYISFEILWAMAQELSPLIKNLSA